MAKKKRRIIEQEEDEYEFTPTEFNEREFILKDLYMTKVFMVVMALGLVMGIVGALVTDHAGSYGWIIATVLVFIVAGLMNKILAAVGFRMEMIEAKSMLGNYLIYLCLALGICILLINPPFAI